MNDSFTKYVFKRRVKNKYYITNKIYKEFASISITWYIFKSSFTKNIIFIKLTFYRKFD